MAICKNNAAFAQTSYGRHIMAHEQHCSAFAAAYVLHLADGLLLEFGVAHGKHFVHHQYFGFQVRSDGESEADGHAAAVALHGGVQVAFASAEVHDLVELAGDFATAHAHDGAVHVDVLAAGHFRVESGAHFEEARDAALGADCAGSGGGHAAEQLEEGALAGAVPADDAHDVALFHLEVDVLQGPHVVAVALVRAVVRFAHLEVGVIAAQHLGLPEPVQVVAERPGAH